jgi:hypothetical protein
MTLASYRSPKTLVRPSRIVGRGLFAGEAIDHDSEPMACRCGAAGCRRLVTGRDWQRPELRRKYGGYFAWYLLEKIRAEPATPNPS